MYWDWQNESNFMVSSTSTHGAAALYSSLNRWSMGSFINFSKTNNKKRGIHRDYILLILFLQQHENTTCKAHLLTTISNHYIKYDSFLGKWFIFKWTFYLLGFVLNQTVKSICNRNHLRSIEISNFQNMVKRKYMTSFW